jgi:hypothetical protein
MGAGGREASRQPQHPRDSAQGNARSAEQAWCLRHAQSRPSARADPAMDRTHRHRHPPVPA